MAFLIVDQPEKGETRFPLELPRICLGRSESNDLCLSFDAAISRKHAEIVRRGNDFVLLDLGSRHGTLVNGVAVQGQQTLSPGDRIQVGHTVVTFVVEEDRRLDTLSAAPGELESMHTVQMPLSEVLNTTLEHQPGASRPGTAAAAPQSRAFAILSQATEQLVAQRPLEEVIEMVMDLVFRAVHPDRGTLMLLEGDPPQLRQRTARGRSPADTSEISISRSIAGMAINEGHAVLVSDAGLDSRFAGAESIVIQRIRSAMCAPLWDNHGVIGLVYVDRTHHAAPYTKDDLLLLSLLANVCAVKIENCRLFVRDEQMRVMERELATAAKIQQHILSARPPEIPGWEISAYNLPCHDVGGDYFDFQPREEGWVALAVGDVSGKGIGAALLTGAVQATFRAHLSTGAEMARVVNRLNRAVVASSAVEQFVTFFCGELNPETATLRYVNAGHNPPLLIRAAGGVEELNRTGLVIGVMEDATYGAEQVAFEPGDLLVMYSDGITEVVNPAGEEFGPERLVRTIQYARKRPVERIQEIVLEELSAFQGKDACQFDDMTLLMLRRC